MFASVMDSLIAKNLRKYMNKSRSLVFYITGKLYFYSHMGYTIVGRFLLL